jgi:carbon storage regulator
VLVLRRRLEEGLLIDGRIHIRVLSVQGDRVQLGIEAPDDVEILRDELVDQVQPPARGLRPESRS